MADAFIDQSDYCRKHISIDNLRTTCCESHFAKCAADWRCWTPPLQRMNRQTA